MINQSVDACAGTDNFVSSLEHAQAQLTLSYNRRGNLAIYLISPQGTRSTLLAPRSGSEGCIHTLYSPSIAESVKCIIRSLSLSDLTITPLRASMTGLSWPPTPGMRTLVENGRWRSRTWLEPTTMVIAHPSNLQGVFLFPLCFWCVEPWCICRRCRFKSNIYEPPVYPVPIQVSFTNIVLTLFKYLLLY